MSRESKIGRNAECPCGSGNKYKNCCDGKIDWNGMDGRPVSFVARHLTLRGKNLHFLGTLLGALQIDRMDFTLDIAKFKGAFSPDAVRDIYSAISQLWPDMADFERSIRAEAGTVSALYTGD